MAKNDMTRTNGESLDELLMSAQKHLDAAATATTGIWQASTQFKQIADRLGAPPIDNGGGPGAGEGEFTFKRSH